MPDPAPPPDPVLTIVASHRPSLPDGDYTLTVEQTYYASTSTKPDSPNGTATLDFSVLGERYALGPNRVIGVFPPDRSNGDVEGCLPHVILDRSTLPWERSAKVTLGAGSPEPPWLAVLLVQSDKPVTLERVTVADARQKLGLPKESGHDDSDPVVLIQVSKTRIEALVETQAPSQGGGTEYRPVSLLSHVREATSKPSAPADGSGDGATADPAPAIGATDRAVVLGDRVIEADTAYTAHLISLEGHGGTDGDGNVAVVSLYRWSFHAAAHHDIGKMLQALDRSAATLGLEGISEPDTQAVVDAGYALLPHGLRTGDRTATWYRGPLVPIGREPSDASAVPAATSDLLLRFDAQTGCLDASHAAAWELGRLIGLADGAYASALAAWKRAWRHTAAAAAAADHSPYHAAPTALPECPAVVRDRLAALARLEDVPFTYLVPDERLLPPESIRFLTVDGHWVDALIDGALSLARVLEGDRLRDEAHYEDGLYSPKDGSPLVRDLFGVLVRSAAVRDVPDLIVEAYPDLVVGAQKKWSVPAASDEATLVRRAHLGPDVLLCLFDTGGRVPTAVDVYPHPHGIHSGLTKDGGDWKLSRPLDDGDGLGPKVTVTADRVQLADLAATIKTFTKKDVSSASVAEALIYGVPRVRYAPDAALTPDEAEVRVVEMALGIEPAYRDALYQAGLRELTSFSAHPPSPDQAKTAADAGVTAAMVRGWADRARQIYRRDERKNKSFGTFADVLEKLAATLETLEKG